MIALWEVCAEVVNKLPVRQVSEPRCSVRHLVVLSWYASYRGVEVLPSIHQLQLPQYWPNGGGCADTTSVIPSLCLGVIDVHLDVCQGRYPWGEYQDLHE